MSNSIDYPAIYKRLIDSETWDYINRVNAAYPPDAVDATIEKQREYYDAMCQLFFAPFPKQVTKTDSTIRSPEYSHEVGVRHYQNAESSTAAALKSSEPATILYLHGGGFVVGSLESHDDICAELCERTGLDVLSVDYRLSPEHRHPAALEDAMAAIEHLSHQRKSIILCGDSAGANLCAAASHRLRTQLRSSEASQTQPTILGQVLIYPGLGGNSHQGSYIEHQYAPMLTLADIRFYEMVRVPEDFLAIATALQDNSDNSVELDENTIRLISDMGPLNHTDFSQLPPTIAISAECDPLHDDGENYCKAIHESGGSAQFVSEKGLVHGYLRARHSVGRAQESFTRIVEAINGFSPK